VSTSIGHTHSSCICTRKTSWGEQGTSSRRVHTTLLRAELSGGRHRHRTMPLGCIEEQESLAYPKLWLSQRIMVPA